MSAMLEFDTGPLNWVRSDIEAALRSAADRIRARSADASIENALRLARDEAHQATGALRMVGLEGAAAVASALEETLSAMDNNSIPVNEACGPVLEALETLLKWVVRMSEGRGDGELALFPAYRKLRELNGAEHVFEGELFYPSLQVQPAQASSAEISVSELAALAKSSRTSFQRGLLAFLKGVQADVGLAAMRKSLVQIESAVPSQAARTFWWACIGFIDALQNKGVEPDFHVKQLLARIDLQMRRLMEGSPQVAERLMRDALFFIAKSKSVGDEAKAVRSAFSLEKYLPKNALFNAEQLSRLRPRLNAINETLTESRQYWNAFAEGNSDALNEFQASIARLGLQAGAIEVPALGMLAGALKDAVSSIVQLDDTIRDAIRLEIATTLLFLQNSITGEDVFERDFPDRAQSQIRRIKAALAGEATGSAEDLVDEGSRKAADHALFAQLGREITSSLHQMEESLDAFFRNPGDRGVLSVIPGLSAQIQGALSMLEQEQASELLKRGLELIDPYLSDGVPGEDEKTRIADALSSISLFIEAHCAGRKDAARILLPAQIAFGLAEAESDTPNMILTVEDGLGSRKSLVAASYRAWQDKGGEDTRKKCLAALTELGHDADLIADRGLKSAVENAFQMIRTGNPDSGLAAAISHLTGHVIEFHEAGAERLSSLEPVNANEHVESASTPLAEATPPELPIEESSSADGNDESDVESEAELPEITEPEQTAPAIEAEEEAPCIDSELLEIFLDEAKEVLDTLSVSADTCKTGNDETECLKVIRRAFHTLKGSGRMVGLTDFGEVAWSMEQLLNGWLADEKPVTTGLVDLVKQAHDHFAEWIGRLREGKHASPDSSLLLANISRVVLGEPLDDGIMPAVEGPEPAKDEESIHEPDEPVETRLVSGTSNTGTDASEPEPEEIMVAGVRLSPALYQIFREESTLWSRQLLEEHTILAGSERPVFSEQARRGIHTLAGIAGTTGFLALADLAHAMDIYLKELESRPLPSHARHTVLDALSRLVGMIDNIHAGAEPLPADALIMALAGLQLEETVPAIEAELAGDFDPPASASPCLGDPPALPEHSGLNAQELSETPAPESPDNIGTDDAGLDDRTETVEPDAIVEPSAPDNPESTETPVTDSSEDQADGLSGEPQATADNDASGPTAAVEEVAQANAEGPAEETRLEDLVAQARRQAHTPVFEQRQVRDEVDAELLPIFLEEAESLVPQAADNLRLWKSQPDNTDLPAELRRALHTIKGSARMAGAMRLGELTHIMESRVIAVLEGGLIADASVFEKLEEQFDRMANDVDRLRQGLAAPETAQTDTEATEIGVVLPPEEAGSAASEAITAQPVFTPSAVSQPAQTEGTVLRVRSDWIDRMVNEAGEVAIARSRVESEMFALKRQVTELSDALRRLKDHMREIEIQAESQMQATLHSHGGKSDFDPLEFDRFSRFQEITRFLAESVHDIATVQQNLTIQLGEADAALLQQARMNRELQQSLLRVRMVPFHSIAERLYRVVRQAGRDLNKRAQLEIRNGELEIDRGVLEKVVAPIEHLLRNAVAHGLEMPEVRVAAGKPEFGEIRIDARQEGNEMVLSITDDGTGLNLHRIREKARAMNLLSDGVEPSESQLAQMIFIPGFSTAEQVTEVSGRGVGMDVVKNEITSLGGRIEIATETGKGVTFSIYLPLTLAVTQAVIVNANRQAYALPATTVEQVQELKPDHLAAAMHARAIEWRGNRYPLFYLPHLIGQMDAVHEVQRFNTVVLMKSGQSYAAVLVDVVEGTREIVVKNTGPQVARITGIAGATVRGDGKIILILNPVPLAVRALNAQADTPMPALPKVEPVQETPQAPMVLVVDDSLTVRKITSRLMTREGYRVDTAKDGVDALEKMQDLIPDIVLLDVEMPRMDGFELARVMRNDANLKHVPIIMITSRTADKHRNHAMEIGVNVYLGKPFQEAVLLGHIGSLLGDRALSHTGLVH